MQPDDADIPPAREPVSRVEREFAAMVEHLRRGDPHFTRRYSVPRASARLTAGAVMTLVGIVATVLLGVVPLVLGLHLGAPAALVVGAAACVILPVAAPFAVGRVLARVRPLWR